MGGGWIVEMKVYAVRNIAEKEVVLVRVLYKLIKSL